MHQQLFGQGAVSVAHDPSEFTHHLTFNQREQMSTHEHVTCAWLLRILHKFETWQEIWWNLRMVGWLFRCFPDPNSRLPKWLLYSSPSWSQQSLHESHTSGHPKTSIAPSRCPTLRESRKMGRWEDMSKWGSKTSRSTELHGAKPLQPSKRREIQASSGSRLGYSSWAFLNASAFINEPRFQTSSWQIKPNHCEKKDFKIGARK